MVRRQASRIAVVVASGDIVRGDPGDDGSEQATLTSFGFNRMLRQVGGDSNIRGVIVRIDSGGGEADRVR